MHNITQSPSEKGRYRVQLSVNGKKVRKHFGKTKLKEAIEWRDNMIAKRNRQYES